MASIIKQIFDGRTGFTDIHNKIHVKAGNITWPNEFVANVESSEERIVEVLLWAFHMIGLCCTIAGEYAIYIGDKLESRPHSISIYIACQLQKCSSDFAVLFAKAT